ncbi:MAG: Wzz/FepE/Etk N-terminal domain-containing protein [Clostridia bacterium]|nr:Wzz/FepE/Etk N-terminal domain-containing protein [Clostridia bacterium]
MTENVTSQKRKTQTNSGEIVIDLQALLGELLRAAPIIIAIALVGAILGFVYSKFFVTPMYRASTSVYVIGRASDTLNTSDLQTGLQLTEDYAQIIKSNTVCERVLEELGIDSITPPQLASMISVSKAGDDTRMLVISVSSSSPSFCQTVANELRVVASDYIVEVMDLPSVNTVDEAKLPTTPYTPNTSRNVMMGFLAGFVIAAGIVVLRYMLNDSLMTEEDVKNRLDLSVLGTVPLQEDENGEGREKKSTFKKYVNRLGYSVKRRTRKH